MTILLPLLRPILIQFVVITAVELWPNCFLGLILIVMVSQGVSCFSPC